MIYSIYHFFYSLVQQKHFFKKLKKLDQFPFDKKLLACRNKGVFPDLAIRLNKDKRIFTGGELIELKDSDSYTVSSFNSTIPSRTKKIEDIITGENSIIKQQMEKAGNDIFSLPARDVYYLVRGRKKNHIKICLVYGSFFETISIENLISQSFSQVLERGKEFLIGKEYWDFLGGENTFEQLLELFDIVGKKFKEKIKEKIQQVDREKINSIILF